MRRKVDRPVGERGPAHSRSVGKVTLTPFRQKRRAPVARVDLAVRVPAIPGETVIEAALGRADPVLPLAGDRGRVAKPAQRVGDRADLARTRRPGAAPRRGCRRGRHGRCAARRARSSARPWSARRAASPRRSRSARRGARPPRAAASRRCPGRCGRRPGRCRRRGSGGCSPQLPGAGRSVTAGRSSGTPPTLAGVALHEDRCPPCALPASQALLSLRPRKLQPTVRADQAAVELLARVEAARSPHHGQRPRHSSCSTSSAPSGGSAGSRMIRSRGIRLSSLLGEVPRDDPLAHADLSGDLAHVARESAPGRRRSPHRLESSTSLIS